MVGRDGTIVVGDGATVGVVSTARCSVSLEVTRRGIIVLGEVTAVVVVV